MTGYDMTWNGVDKPASLVVENIDRDLLGEHTGVFVHIPGRSGAWYFPDERGRRLVECHCYILADSYPQNRRMIITQVADWLDVNGETTLVLGDDPDVFYRAVLVDAPNLREWRHLGRFDLLFSVDPWAYDNDPTVITFNQESDDEWTYDFGVGVATYPVIEVINTSGGTISGFFFTMNDNTLNFQGDVPDDGIVTINSIGLAVLAGANDDTLLTGVYEPSESLMSLVQGTFPTILPGPNDMEINTETPGATLDIRVTYRKRYRN